MLKTRKLTGSGKTCRRPSRTNTQQRCPFHYRGLECKSRKSRYTLSNGQIWPWSIKWSRAKANKGFAKRPDFWWAYVYRGVKLLDPRALLLKLSCPYQSPGGLLNMHSLLQQIWDRPWESVFLTSLREFQMYWFWTTLWVSKVVVSYDTNISTHNWYTYIQF